MTAPAQVAPPPDEERCDRCDGSGLRETYIRRGDVGLDVVVDCAECDGTGVRQ